MTDEDEDDLTLWAFHPPLTGSFILYQKCVSSASSTPAVFSLNMAQPLLGSRIANASICLFDRLLLEGVSSWRSSLLEGFLESYSTGGRFVFGVRDSGPSPAGASDPDGSKCGFHVLAVFLCDFLIEFIESIEFVESIY